MALILSIDTSSNVCSVAIHEDGQIVGFKESDSVNSHSENLTLFIDSLLCELSLKLSDLDAIAVSEGPGSYTGLRIGVSTAKGLCFALDIPLINVKTLASLASLAIESTNQADGIYSPMLDARRMEVYHALFSQTGSELKATAPMILDEDSLKEFNDQDLYYFGNGSAKAHDLFADKGFKWIDGIITSARGMGILAYSKFIKQDFVDVAYFEPYYLKDVRITVSKKNV